MSYYLNPWYWITLLGTPEWWAGLAIGVGIFYLLFRNHKSFTPYRNLFKGLCFTFILSLFLVFGIVHSLKSLSQVARPCTIGEGLYCPEDYSFPSGHAAIGFTLFTTLLLFDRKDATRLGLVFALLVSYSRLALGVHTFLDVVVGSLLGIGITLLVHRALFRYKLIKK